MVEAGTLTIKVTPEGLREALPLIERLAADAARLDDAIKNATVKIGATVTPLMGAGG